MKLSPAQIAAFGIVSGAGLERKLATAVCARFPRALAWYGDDALMSIVRAGIERARACGIEAEDGITDYLSLMLLFGSGFESDPQTQWVADLLAGPEETAPPQRVAGAWKEAQGWRQKVFGADDGLYREALGSIRGRSVEELTKYASRSQRDLLLQLAAMHPAKFSAVGQQPLFDLTRVAVEACRPFELLDRWAVVLVAELMFLFGAGFMSDPRYAWAPRALEGAKGSVDEKLDALLTAAQGAAEAMLA